MEQLFCSKKLAEILGIAEQTIYNRHSIGGDLPASIKIGRSLRFRASDVISWLDAKQKTDKTTLPVVSSASKKRRGRPTKREEIAARR